MHTIPYLGPTIAMRSTDESYKPEKYHRLVIDSVSKGVDRSLSCSAGLEGAGGVVYAIDVIDVSGFVQLL